MRDSYRLSTDRLWLLDDRSPPRRLQVSHHPDRRVVVLSVWQERVCTATFQLPLAQAPTLIDVLVGALADAAREPAPPAIEQRTGMWARLCDWARARISRTAA